MIETRREDIAIGVLGTISIGTEKYVAAIGIEMKVEHSQKNSFTRDSFRDWYLDAKKTTASSVSVSLNKTL